MKYSFQKGFKQIPIGKAAEVKGELMEALSVKSRPAWRARLTGKVEPKVSEARKIEKIFAHHGVKEIWGE